MSPLNLKAVRLKASYAFSSTSKDWLPKEMKNVATAQIDVWQVALMAHLVEHVPTF